jgi:DNA-binding PadR family transcriptional regulator
MSNLEYHLLLALAEGALHGYAIREAIERESGGALMPRAGSMYRLLSRLLKDGLVREAAVRAPEEPHPGLARRYYTLTAQGRRELAAEARRLKSAATLAEKRLRAAEGRS